VDDGDGTWRVLGRRRDNPVTMNHKHKGVAVLEAARPGTATTDELAEEILFDSRGRRRRRAPRPARPSRAGRAAAAQSLSARLMIRKRSVWSMTPITLAAWGPCAATRIWEPVWLCPTGVVPVP
jgi:hypothetical protein